MLDYSTIDNPRNLVRLPYGETNIDFEELEGCNEVVKKQYINFQNLGVDMLKTVPDNYKPAIFKDMVLYIHDMYTPIADIDNMMIFNQRLMEIGEIVYKFICMDAYNAVIPNFLSKIGCSTLEQFDVILAKRFNHDYGLVKASIVKTIKETLENLMRLKTVDQTISKDKSYQETIKKYSYFIELVDFGSTDRFINNYVRPVFAKNEAEIQMRQN